jgi:hypothetical protein
MKADASKPARREIFVLTSEEKKTICFVLIAFVLGLATKYYRDNYPVVASKPAAATRGHATPKSSPTSRP